MLGDGPWSVKEVRGIAPVGRRQVTIVRAWSGGYELCLYLRGGRIAGRTRWRKAMQAGATYVANGGLKVGVYLPDATLWRRAADGA